ncbi:hypothetical protein EST38_g2605 [Candolleomyces aberdarensis]|uniref:Uncharacterized protein n=1 Tax=Candolleomyces aberdarensis TaxID=2316362 RepID=A0A4Q2DU89_9AGAR|nr:hypothetical protein EST38_g2605 [Candolleomyces aberdarensis]
MVTPGVIFFISIYGLSVYLETPKNHRKGRTRYIALSLIITALTVLSTLLESAWLFGVLFTDNSGNGFSESMKRNGRSWERFTSPGLSMATVVLGDALLVYRCYVIWKRTWWVVILPSLTLITALVISVFALVFEVDASRTVKFESARTLLTVSTNILATGLISFYLLRARYRLSYIFPSKELQLYTGVVAILIESALPLSVFGIIYGAMALTGHSVPKAHREKFLVAWYTVSALFYTFCALAPVMIIFRVTTVQMRELTGVKINVVRAANAVLDQAVEYKSKRKSKPSPEEESPSSSSSSLKKNKSASLASPSPKDTADTAASFAESSNKLWASIARYNDALVDFLEDWEAKKRTMGCSGPNRKPVPGQ